MERLIEQQPRHEQQKSFDITANVAAMRHDLDQYGYVLPETREQVGNEQLSYLAEGVGRAARTTFVLPRQGAELVYFDDGRWRPYSDMLATGLAVARAEAIADPRRQFLAEWAENDYYHYARMRTLRPGERYTWISSYAHEQEVRHGMTFMRECGLVPDRKMGFIYQARCLDDGTVELESQTVDQSDSEAFAAVMDGATDNPHANLDELTDSYDQVLRHKFGGPFYAGRREVERDENVWEFINEQGDLVEHLLDGLENIARRRLASADEERATKEHVYGVWALFKKRLDGTAAPAPGDTAGEDYASRQAWLEGEVQTAFHEFVAQGQVLVGCGGAIGFLQGEGIMGASPEEVFESIFGKRGEDKYGSLTFRCRNGHMNTRPHGKLLSNCQICGDSVRC